MQLIFAKGIQLQIQMRIMNFSFNFKIKIKLSQFQCLCHLFYYREVQCQKFPFIYLLHIKPMQQQPEGFQQFSQKNMYYQTQKTMHQAVGKVSTKNNNKMIYKSPLTIFYGVCLCELTTQVQSIPLNLAELLKEQQYVYDLQHEEIQIQPLKQFLNNNLKNTGLQINEQNAVQQEKLNEYFPKRYICAYNKFSQNLFLKNDLTILIKNISRCIQLQMLISFKGYIVQPLNQDIKTGPQGKYKKDSQRKSVNSSPFQRKNLEVTPVKQHRKPLTNSIHKTFDQLRIRKTILKNFYNNKGQQQEIQFFSNFQSGNLHLAFVDKRNPLLYYLMLTNDINTHGCNQWFYFGVRVKSQKKYRFVIMNVSKDFRHEQQMKILCYSKSKWRRSQPYLCYKNKFSKYNGGNLISIDFEYQFNKQIKQEDGCAANQEVFFAFAYPYTYTKLLSFLKLVTLKHSLNFFVTVQSIGKTQIQNYIPVVKIQSADKKIITAKTNKPVILIVARQHASQTSSSFIVEQIIKNLTDQGGQASNLAESLLSKYDFHIIPMANPDGVAHGNSRTNVKGYDINRCWEKGKSSFTRESAETQCINKYIQGLMQQKKIDYAIDLHSHSKEFGSFAYFSQKNEVSKLFSYFFCQKFKECRYSKCRVDLSYKKKQTFRGQMYYNLGIKNSLTIQTSYYGYKRVIDEQQDQTQLIPFTLQNYSNIAISILNALNQIACHSKFSDRFNEVNSIIQKWDMEAARLKQKAKWKGQFQQSSNQSDSAPQEDFLLVKQRKQIGQSIPENANNQSQLEEKQISQQKSKQTPSKKQLNVFLTQSKVFYQEKNQQNQKKRKLQPQNQNVSRSQGLKNKRKRIYTNASMQSIVRIYDRDKVSSSINHQQLTNKYQNLDKQLEKRSTLRQGIKFGSSKSLNYRSLSEHKKKVQIKKSNKQNLEEQKTISYPTSCDLNLSYASIRIMHQNLHKNRIKVKDIKNQTLLRRFRNQQSSNKGNKTDLSSVRQTLTNLSKSFVTGSTIKKLLQY